MAGSAAGLTSYQHLSSSAFGRSSFSSYSSRHLLTGFYEGGARRMVVMPASWPLKQDPDAPKLPEIKTKRQTQMQGISKSRAKPMPKPKLDIAHLLERRSNAQGVPVPDPAGILPDEPSNCQTWLPSAPKVSRPQSIYNAATLAYLGDCIYELYVRRHFFYPPLNINEYNRRVMALVCCEAQDALLKELLKDDFLSEEERDIIRWGGNIEAGKTRTIRRAGAAVYSRASSLETLVGYLYLTNANRLDTTMRKLGFCIDNSM
uniref:RNase III domain-containing protein n=1 Tax=Araucaria cunninghamii TaxID=56994 RepID=A0A0D6RAX7_ARACU